MNEMDLFIRFSFLGLSTLLSIISLLSFRKTKEIKIAFATIGFLVFTILGSIVVLAVFLPSVKQIITIEVLIGSIVVSLIFFYLSIVKR